MSVKKTPQHVDIELNEIVNHLNATWNLGLFRLHGQDAETAADEETDVIARRCSGRLRGLCIRTDILSVQKLVSEFEERAEALYTEEWVYKPAQEKGTIPRRVTKSFLKRDARGRKPDAEQLKQLLQTLENVLQDPYDLAKQSTSFQLHDPPISTTTKPCISTPTTPPRLAPRRMAYPSSLRIAEQTQQSPADTAKKQKKRPSEASDNAEASRKRPTLTNRTIETFFTRTDSTAGAVTRSFDTLVSNEPSEVFDKPFNQSVASSANTSILDGADADKDDSQEYFQTQEAMDLVEDESFQQLSHAIESKAESWADCLRKAPLSTTISLPEDLPFVSWYELHRIAILWSLHPSVLYKEVVHACKNALPTYEEFWRAISSLQRANNTRARPERCGARAYAKLVQYNGRLPEDSKSVYLSGRLDWTKDTATTSKGTKRSVFNLQLKAPKVDKSCRFHNVFGGHRFLTLEVPFITEGSLSKERHDLRADASSVQQSIVEWLATQEHKIAGRMWRPFYAETDQARSKDVQRYHKVYLFATRGAGLVPNTTRQPGPFAETSIQDFINWHAPLSPNHNSSDLKLFQRFKLGLSKTVATVELVEQEFKHLPDKEPVMNDGCALMSFRLGQEITKKLGLLAVPAAFQGRISGAKGLWIVDRRNKYRRSTPRGFWIEVSDSQLKIKPHPKDRPNTVPQLRTFEFSQCSAELSPAALNVQLLTILADRGVPKQLVATRLEWDIKDYYEGLCNSMEDSQSLCAWLQKYHRIVRDVDEVNMLGSLPDEKLERILMLLRAGFEPKTCSFLTDLLYDRLRSRLKLYVDKLLIRLPLSTTAYCIADPYGVLELDEVHLGFSRPWLDPETRTEHSQLHDINLLVGRNPALLPTDIQKRRAVFKHELADLRDVIIFSTKGDTPLASLLSGGDYDGDRCWVCWDEDVVKSFINSSTPAKLPTESECGLMQRSRKISSIVKGTKATETEINDFLTGCLAFNLQPTFLGSCNVQHERLIYQTGSLNSKEARKLAALAVYLVDCAKQGFVLSEKDWYRVRNEACGTKRLPDPAYKEESKPRDYKSDNMIDYLKWDVAECKR